MRSCSVTQIHEDFEGAILDNAVELNQSLEEIMVLQGIIDHAVFNEGSNGFHLAREALVFFKTILSIYRLASLTDLNRF